VVRVFEGEGQIADVLLVEDNPADARLATDALADAKIRVHPVRDGTEALAFLGRTERYAQAPRPDLILLDLNLPGLDGWDVLVEIKKDRRLRSIPIVILTTSAEEPDVLKSYDLQASCYVTKPVDLDQFRQAIRDIAYFWLSVARLPS